MERQIEFDNPPGATSLDPDELDGLKIKHITTRGELDRWEQDNISEAISWLNKRRNRENVLSEDFLIMLHKKMLEKVWTWAGGFRRSGKNIGVDWPTISIELRRLLDDVSYWIENATYSPDEIAVRFHHRLVWVHLFPNGNGRHARLATDSLLKDVLKVEPFTWGSERLEEKGNVRDQYIHALRQADNHDYSELLAFVRS